MSAWAQKRTARACSEAARSELTVASHSSSVNLAPLGLSSPRVVRPPARQSIPLPLSLPPSSQREGARTIGVTLQAPTPAVMLPAAPVGHRHPYIPRRPHVGQSVGSLVHQRTALRYAPPLQLHQCSAPLLKAWPAARARSQLSRLPSSQWVTVGETRRLRGCLQRKNAGQWVVQVLEADVEAGVAGTCSRTAAQTETRADATSP